MASESIMSSVGSNSVSLASSESSTNSGIIHDQTDALLDCNICYNAPPTSPVITHCGHMYCWPCLQQWLQDKETCPVCRTVLSSGVNVVHIHGPGRGDGRDEGNPNVVSPNPPSSERPSQLPSRTEVLAAIDVLLRANQRLQDERKAASEAMRDQLNALNWELGQMRSQSVESSLPQQEQESTLHLMQELIDRTVDALQESDRIRQLLDEASRMGDRLVRMRRFVRANREYADLWTSGIV